MFSRSLNQNTLGGTPLSLGSYARCQDLIVSLSTCLWLRCVTFIATPMCLSIWGTGPFRVITRLYVLSFKKPSNQGQQGKRFPSWVSRHPGFCSILKRLHDDHRYSADPIGALADFKTLIEEGQKGKLFASSHARRLTAWEQTY